MKIKPATQAQADALQRALRSLRDARYCLMFADCPQALDAVRRALKSAEGAQRHMLRRLQHRDPVTGEPLRIGPSTEHAFGEPRGAGSTFLLLEPGYVTEAQENAHNARRCS